MFPCSHGNTPRNIGTHLCALVCSDVILRDSSSAGRRSVLAQSRQGNAAMRLGLLLFFLASSLELKVRARVFIKRLLTNVNVGCYHLLINNCTIEDTFHSTYSFSLDLVVISSQPLSCCPLCCPLLIKTTVRAHSHPESLSRFHFSVLILETSQYAHQNLQSTIVALFGSFRHCHPLFSTSRSLLLSLSCFRATPAVGG